MIEQLGLEYGNTKGLETLEPLVKRSKREIVTDSQNAFSPPQASKFAPWEAPSRESQTTCIKLDLENLKCFEVVDCQFEDCGITFTNAIALQPSNPAFPPRSGSIVLMGGPRTGWMEATFKQPVCVVSCFVTSSRQAVLSAYDSQDCLLGKTEIPESNLAGSGSAVEPNRQLCLQIPNIHRVTFYAFDGQFSLDDFQVCFQSALAGVQ